MNSQNWTVPSELNAIFFSTESYNECTSGCSHGHQRKHRAGAKTSGPKMRVCDFAVVQKRGRMFYMVIHLLFRYTQKALKP